MPPFRLTALGDSFTEGREDPAGDGQWTGWVTRLAGMLGIPPAEVRNLGAHHATTQTVVDEQLPPALGGKSPLIGVIVGVNDLISDYDQERVGRNLMTIFGQLAGLDTVVFTATYTDIPANLPVPETFRSLLRRRFTEANEALAEITTATGVLCLDVMSIPGWHEPGFWSADGLHPNALGHQRFAEAVADLLERAADVPVVAAAGRY